MEPGTPALAVIRHSRVEVRSGAGSTPDGPNLHDGRVELVNYLGESIQYVCTVGDAERIIASATIAAARAVPLEAGRGDRHLLAGGRLPRDRGRIEARR